MLKDLKESCKSVLTCKPVMAFSLAVPTILSAVAFADGTTDPTVASSMTTTATNVNSGMIVVVPAIGTIIGTSIAINFGFKKIKRFAK